MLKLSLLRCLLPVLLLCLPVANVSAQETELVAPPLPDFVTGPPPDPESLESPPSLEWEPLESVDPEQGTNVTPPEPFVVLPPEPEAPPDAPPVAEILPGKDLDPEKARPEESEVWREESEFPQMPNRQGAQFDPAYIKGPEPVLVRLQFDPIAAGSAVVVKPGPGVTVDPPETEFYVGPTGECVVSVALDGDFLQSDMNVFCLGIRTRVPLARAPLTTVVAQEEATGGAR
jgi:hypothetical protein